MLTDWCLFKNMSHEWEEICQPFIVLKILWMLLWKWLISRRRREHQTLFRSNISARNPTLPQPFFLQIFQGFSNILVLEYISYIFRFQDNTWHMYQVLNFSFLVTNAFTKLTRSGEGRKGANIFEKGTLKWVRAKFY